jgi:hypothetical protein
MFTKQLSNKEQIELLQREIEDHKEIIEFKQWELDTNKGYYKPLPRSIKESLQHQIEILSQRIETHLITLEVLNKTTK